jgi:hypothetical protein
MRNLVVERDVTVLLDDVVAEEGGVAGFATAAAEGRSFVLSQAGTVLCFDEALKVHVLCPAASSLEGRIGAGPCGRPLQQRKALQPNTNPQPQLI